MKKLQSGFFGWPLILAVMLFSANLGLQAQTNTFRRVPSEYGIIPLFTNNPFAMYVITNLLHEPMPELAVPTVSETNSAPGTYWPLKGPPVPLPYDPYPELDVYQVSTNGQFIIDDRSVDYATLSELEALEAIAFAATNPPVFTACQTCAWNEHGLLWIEVPTNSLATAGMFNVVLHNTVEGQSYDILTTSNLLGSWTAELVVTGAVGNLTPVAVAMDSDTNKFVRARTSVNYSFYVVTPPLSQDVLAYDTVTFYVETGGNTNLTFQWTLNGSLIEGATNSSYTVTYVTGDDAGQYACIISDGINSLTTAVATLTVESGTGDLNLMAVVGPRQNYTFKTGVTYYVGDVIPLYGKTTIEAGAVIKFDWYDNPSLVIMGTLDCKGAPYYPAVLTSVDDDSTGEALGFSDSDGGPQPYVTGVPYLELACDQTNVISNLRIEYADWGVTTPTASRLLDAWDCQFVGCNYGIVNLVAGDSTNRLHNVLFAACGAVFGAATNAITVEAEQVTADVGDFALSLATPSRISLTNCILWGNAPNASSLASVHVALNPDDTNFVSSFAGFYYLAANSPLHQSGDTNISPRLQKELKKKSTCAPLAIAPLTKISGQMTLSPQAQRYAGGAPDLGYHYDALDYTIGGMILAGGTLNILPDTAIGFRLDYIPQEYTTSFGAVFDVTYVGLDVWENSTVNAQGMPGKPCVFVDVQQVQEQWAPPVMALIVPDFWPASDSDQPPILNFRFADFYAGYVPYYRMLQYEFWSGISLNKIPGTPFHFEWSPDSAMNLTLQDCKILGGQIGLGTPDNSDTYGIYDYDTVVGSGAVAWNNSAFEGVSIFLDPTYYWYNQIVNCDLQVTAYNNLFRNIPWLYLAPVPASAGNWTLRDNFFDKVQFGQYRHLPLDFDHNGYWPLTPAETLYSFFGYTNQLLPTATSSGATEVFLTNAPPYQCGAFGSYYLSATTALYQAGSRIASDAGLSQYTTFANQRKDASNLPVNIGLHYVAATNSLALDSDGDGVPDYVEVEHGTDPNNPMTDGVTNDLYNVAYDDVDLDGDGLTGRAEKILGTNPLIQDNPLKLTPVITGQEPYILTYSMPLAKDVKTNQCQLSLYDNGTDVGLYDFEMQSNGTYLVEWNSTTAANGSHCLQVKLSMAGYALPKNSGGPQPVLAVSGLTRLENVQNIVQLDSDETSFGSQASFSGTLAVQSADYQIQIFDTNSVLLTTITNHTDTGMISETWDLTDNQGNSRSDDEFDAKMTVTPSAQSNGFITNAIPIWRFKKGNCGDLFSLAYGEFSDGYFAHLNRADMIRQSVEDVLFDPALNNEYTSSPLNGQGWENTSPFYMNDSTNKSALSAQQESLVEDLAQGSVGNFFWNGHGSESSIGDGSGVSLSASTVGISLGNIHIKMKGVKGRKIDHPYRFVILDACECGNAKLWPRAFGITDQTHYAEWFQKVGEPSQALLGWKVKINASTGATEVQSEGEHLGDFFGAWMSGLPLVECVNIGATPDAGFWPFDIPLDPNWKIFGDPFLTRSP